MEMPSSNEGGDSGATAAGDSNLLSFDLGQPDSSGLTGIKVFRESTLRRLNMISALPIFCEIIQLICQVCLIMQSRRLSVSAVSAILVIWTVLALMLTTQWIILLSRNRIGIVKKGKMLICGCQGLAFLSLLASVVLVVQNDDKWRDISSKWLVCTILACNCMDAAIFFVLFIFVIRGQKVVHQLIGSWLWQAIQQHIQRQQLTSDAEIKDHLLTVYDADKLYFTAAAA